MYDKNIINFIGYPINNVTMSETLSIIEDMIQNNTSMIREDINAAKLVWMQKDKMLSDAIINAQLINADGQSIVMASKLLGKPLKERVTGVDLMEECVALAYKKGYKIFLLGAKEEVVQKVVAKYSEKYSSEIIAGYRNGYFNEDDESTIVNMIAHSNANMLFVGINSPKKEFFINKYHDDFNVNFITGVGGSFDVIAGVIKRAPIWMQKYGLEWFYRFLQEPGRMWKRYLYTNSMFLWLVFKEKLFKN